MLLPNKHLIGDKIASEPISNTSLVVLKGLESILVKKDIIKFDYNNYYDLFYQKYYITIITLLCLIKN